MESTWEWRELPILGEALRRVDAGETSIPVGEIRDAVGLTQEQAWAGVRALADAEYIEVRWGATATASVPAMIEMVKERARRELGSWPSAETILQSLVDALGEAAERESEPEEKGRLREAAEVIGGAAKDLAVAVIAAKIPA